VVSRRTVSAPGSSPNDMASLEQALTDTAGVVITNFAYIWTANRTTSPGGAQPSFFTAQAGTQTALNVALRIAPSSTNTLSFPAHYLHWEQVLPLRSLGTAEIAQVLAQTVRGGVIISVLPDPPDTQEQFPTHKRASVRIVLLLAPPNVHHRILKVQVTHSCDLFFG